MSGEGKCLYYWVKSGLDSIRHEEKFLAEQEAKLEAEREALLVRCGWSKTDLGGGCSLWSRGTMRLTTNEALSTVREAYEIMTGPKDPAVKPDDSPGDLS